MGSRLSYSARVLARRLPVLRVGIAGLGQAGRAMVPAFLKHPRVKITAVADCREETLHQCRQVVEAELYTDVEQMCADGKIDAVYVATPTHLHAEHVSTAIESGKHVIVEKPMATTLHDAQQMIAAANRNGVWLVVGHSQSFEPPIQKMRDLVRSGELGRIRMIHNWCFTDWLYRPRLPEELDTSLGGGATLRQGAHQVDILRWIGGGLVRSVRATVGVWDPTRPGIGSHVMFLDFLDGTVGTAVFSGYDHFMTAELTYGVGEGGRTITPLSYAQARTTLRNTTDQDEATRKRAIGLSSLAPTQQVRSRPYQSFYGLTIVSCDGGDVRQSRRGLLVYGDDRRWEIPLSSRETGRDRVVHELYNAFAYDQPPPHDGRWGLANLEVCLAAIQSARERREIILSHQIATPD